MALAAPATPAALAALAQAIDALAGADPCGLSAGEDLVALEQLSGRLEAIVSRALERLSEEGAHITLDPIAGAIVAGELERPATRLHEADVAEARARLGHDPGRLELARTPPQRRGDALVEMARRSGATDDEARPFTDPARRAVELRDRVCLHPCCEVALEPCQVDHIVPAREGGPTPPRPTGGCCAQPTTGCATPSRSCPRCRGHRGSGRRLGVKGAPDAPSTYGRAPGLPDPGGDAPCKQRVQGRPGAA